MITSKLQLKASKKAMATLREILEAEPSPQLSPKLAQATRKKTERKLSEIKGEINEYETYSNANLEDIPMTSFDDLLKAPIRCRLAMNESVKEFAELLEVNKRQILRYEEEGYENCSMTTFKKILTKVEKLIENSVEHEPAH